VIALDAETAAVGAVATGPIEPGRTLFQWVA
jgi:hypothetical protein